MTTTRPWLKPGFRLGSSWVARFDDQAEKLVTLGMTNRMALWDVVLRMRIGAGPTLSHVSHAEFSADGARVVAKNTSGEVVVFDAAMSRS